MIFPSIPNGFLNKQPDVSFLSIQSIPSTLMKPHPKYKSNLTRIYHQKLYPNSISRYPLSPWYHHSGQITADPFFRPKKTPNVPSIPHVLWVKPHGKNWQKCVYIYIYLKKKKTSIFPGSTMIQPSPSPSPPWSAPPPWWRPGCDPLRQHSPGRCHRCRWNLLGPGLSGGERFYSITHLLHVWYIQLHNWVIFRANVGKYSSTMEHMGCNSIGTLYMGRYRSRI